MEAEADRMGQRAAAHAVTVQAKQAPPTPVAAPRAARLSPPAMAMPASSSGRPRGAVQRSTPVSVSHQLGPVMQLKPSVLQPARYGKPTADPIPERLEYGSSTMATTCAMILFRHDLVLISARTFTSGGGLHAEEKVIAYLQALVDNGTLVPQGVLVKDYIVFLAVSKSPCSSTSMPATRTDGNPGCLERLTALNAAGLTSATTGLNVPFAVQLAATKPYQGKVAGGKAASTGSYGGFGGGGGGGGTFGFVR